MDIRLYWEKVYWALAKRVFKRKQKTYEIGWRKDIPINRLSALL